MRNLKKLVALIVTIAMIATLAVSAFAATPADVKGTDYEGAVTRLVALGVITGYPNGDFGPNDSITRAQAAAVVVRALGYESIADSAKGVTKFSDVAANYWGAGYINLAVSLGIIKGYGNGKFGPEDKVTFEQVVTMVVRALGQEGFAENKGGFPTGYLLQAKVIGFTNDVKGVSGTNATRGIVAQLVDNAKAKDIYEQTTSGGDVKTYQKVTTEGQRTLLEKMGMIKVSGDSIITQTTASAGLDANKFVAGGTTYEAVAGMFDFESLLGQKVSLWKNADGKVVLAEAVAGTAVAVKKVNDVTVSGSVYTVKTTLADGTDKDYTLTVASGAGALENLAVKGIVDVVNDLKGVAADRVQINFVVDGDGNILFANTIKFASAIKITADPTVNNVSKWIRLFTGFYIKYNDKSPKKVVIVKDGKVVDYTALKANDVLFIAGSGDSSTIEDNYVYVKATSQTVTGTLSAAKTDTNLTKATSIKVGGTWYDVSDFKGTIDADSAMDDNITLTLDPAGKAYEIASTTVASADKYGVIIGSEKKDSLGETVYNVKLLTSGGDKIVYTVAQNDDTKALTDLITGPSNAGSAVGKLVKYAINADGNLSKTVVAAGHVDSSPITAAKLKYGDSTYVNPDVVVFAKNGVADYSVVKWADLKDESVEAAYSMMDSGEYVALILNAPKTVTTSDVYAYAVEKTAIAGGKYIIDLVNKSGTDSLKTSNEKYASAGKVFKYTIDNDKVITIAEADRNIAATTGDTAVAIQAASATRIKVGDTYYYFTDDTIIVYDKDGDGGSDVEKLTKADLYSDMMVKVYSTGSDINVLVVTEM